MDIHIRQETPQDYPYTELVVQKAFEDEEQSDQTEHVLVHKLRKTSAFVLELSLVAERDGELVGHVLLTKIMIEQDGTSYDSLALAPVSVLPKYQLTGIGIELLKESLKRAKEMGFTSVVVLGHAVYYPRFGFRSASSWGIRAPLCPSGIRR